MYPDLMVDLEYLASNDNAVITQIAAVPFDITNGFHDRKVSFNESPCIQGQLDEGRTIDANTLSFWMNQCAKDGGTPEWMDDPTDILEDNLLDLMTWGGEHFDWEEIRVWSHDMGKLNHAHRSYSTSIPWLRRHEWHIQTLRKLAGIKGAQHQTDLIHTYRIQKTHDALDDCVAQIKVVTLCWDILEMEN